MSTNFLFAVIRFMTSPKITATVRAIDMFVSLAICPQIALPKAQLPIKLLKYKDIPLALTHAGSDNCAETCNVDTAHIQDIPEKNIIIIRG